MDLSCPSFRKTDAKRGECFHNAWSFAMLNRSWSVVHGIPVGHGPIAGVKYGHAWNEITHCDIRWVYDPSSDMLMPAALYYMAGRIQYTVTYTAEEARELSLEHEHSGPWDDTVNQAESMKPKRRKRGRKADRKTE